ncbi:hypothetical protein MLD38_032093 [Melastoma candidum]|uniref:Uncharacterized protein n=1 Tax=Melastoma candidum TaxID=119954 RepID=A0ACB9M4U0_9MYRT|nr:hypothetical protein MLD38_032093 [Melastoma candidum]
MRELELNPKQENVKTSVSSEIPSFSRRMSALVGIMENEAAKLSEKVKLWGFLESKSKNHPHKEEAEEEEEEENDVGIRKRAGKGVALVRRKKTEIATISDATLSLILDRFSPC